MSFQDATGQIFECLTCGECGIVFYVPRDWVTRRRDHGEHGGEFCCPNGHCRVWKESALDKMRRERDRLKQDQARLEQEKQEAWATANAQLERAQKAEAEVKRVRKRAAAALCPCCNRHFANVERHIKTKHPDVVPMPGRKIAPVRATP